MSDEQDQIPSHIKQRTWAAGVFDQVRGRQPVPEADRLKAKAIIEKARQEDAQLADTPSTEKGVLVDKDGNMTSVGPDGRFVHVGTVQQERQRENAAAAAKKEAERQRREAYLNSVDDAGNRVGDWDPNAS